MISSVKIEVVTTLTSCNAPHTIKLCIYVVLKHCTAGDHPSHLEDRFSHIYGTNTYSSMAEIQIELQVEITYIYIMHMHDSQKLAVNVNARSKMSHLLQRPLLELTIRLYF